MSIHVIRTDRSTECGTQGTRRSSPSVLLPLIVIGLAGCDKPTDPEPPPLTGEWTGEVVDFGDTGTVTFVLTEGEQGSLTGTMTLVHQGITNPGTTRGSYVHPNVVLNFELNRGDGLVRGAYTARRVTYNRLEGLMRLDDGALAVLTLERRATTSRWTHPREHRERRGTRVRSGPIIDGPVAPRHRASATAILDPWIHAQGARTHSASTLQTPGPPRAKEWT